MNSKTTEEKKILRKLMRSRLEDYFSSNDGKIDSALVSRKVLELDEFKSSHVVLAFLSAKNEIDSQLIIDVALATGKTVAVPKVKSECDMDFFILNPDEPLENQVAQGSFGILEPNDGLTLFQSEHFSGQKIFVVVPGLSFTQGGSRLGKGKGFYDRFIRKMRDAGANLFLCGICFPFQIEQAVPENDFDEKMDFVAY